MPVTPIQKAACATVAGLLFSASHPLLASAQTSTQETQPPAPIVRAVPPPVARPKPLSSSQASPKPAAPATPGATPPLRRPRPATQTTDPASAPVRQGPGTPAASRPTTAAGAAAPKPATTASAAPKTAPVEHRPSLSATGLNRNIIVLDPAHGGSDSGARIGDTTLEKSVTLSFAFRLRSLLVARGFTVVLTRDSDTTAEPAASGTALSLDDRAGIANHARAAACLLLHATGRGMGVHLYNSELAPATAEAALLPWLTAQAAWVPASQALEAQMTAALNRSHIQLVSSTASVRPVDSLTCPALVLELAPETDSATSVNDAGYQNRVAAAVAGALVVWENAVQPPVRLPAAPYVPHLKKRETPAADSAAQPAPEAQP